MKGEQIYVEHPRDSYSRMGGLHHIYFDIAEQEYVKCLELKAIDVSNMHEGEKAELGHLETQHAIKAIIFSALCVEAAINNYAGIHFGDSYAENHLHSMDVISKWVVIPKLACGKSIDKSGPAFSCLKKLIKSRNRLIHNKSSEFIPNTKETAMKLEKRDQEFDAEFANSLRTLYFLCMEMDYVLGQMHNPVKTLDRKFSPSLEIPSLVKSLFEECKNTVLRIYS